MTTQPQHRSADTARAVVMPVVAASLALFLLELTATVDIRRRYMLAIYGASLIAALLYASVPLRRMSRRALVTLGMAFSISVGLVGLGALLSSSPRSSLVDGLFPTLSGWTALLILLRVDERGALAHSRDSSAPRRVLLVGLAAIVALLAVVHLVAVGSWAAFGDETLYLAQSRWMQWREIGWPVEADLADFFRNRKAEYGNGQIYTMYPPGWPALLALFRAIGLEWWSVVALGTTSVVLAYLIVARTHGASAALMAAALLATSQQFLMAHAGYMSHAASICASLAAMLCLLVGIDSTARKQLAWCAASGVFMGFVVTTRPLTGLALGGSITLWALLGLRLRSRPALARVAVGLLAGGLVPGILLVAHNLAVYGEALTVGYSAVAGDVYDLGFGPRGVSVLDENLVRQPVASEFTPRRAFGHLFERLAGVNITFVPIGLLLPVLGVSLASGAPVRWSRVSVFLLLPVAHLLYWYGGLRLYIELLPFVIMGLAVVLAELRPIRPRLASAMFVTLVVGSSVMMLPWPRGDHQDARRWSQSSYSRTMPVTLETSARVDSLSAEFGSILLFVRDNSEFDNLIGTLFMFNGGQFEGPVLVARDRGATNAVLMRRFPARVPFLVEELGGGQQPRFTRLGGT